MTLEERLTLAEQDINSLRLIIEKLVELHRSLIEKLAGVRP